MTISKLSVQSTSKTIQCFYARKQLLLSAHLSHRNSVCQSVCLSHGWISQASKQGSPNLHCQLPWRLYSFRNRKAFP